MSQDNEQPFYIGYLAVPSGLKLFLMITAGVLVGMFAALALAIGSAHDNPGQSAFQWGWGAQTVTGTVQAKPYPVLHVTQGSDRIPAGRTLILSSGGKNGVQKRLDQFDGQTVTLRGIALKRGKLDGLQVGGGKDAIKPSGQAGADVATEKLGRWRLKGEICDGKCLVGAMRPGRGLSHRACANLCLIGGVPPVFVASAPVSGSEFLLIGNRDGGPLPAGYLKYVALYVALDGDVERRGNMLVFKADFDTLEVLR